MTVTMIAASIFVDRTDAVSAAVERGREAAGRGASLIEWRLDRLAAEPGGAEAALRLVRESPLPCIVTCRPAWEGGYYEGDEPGRFELLRRLAAAEPAPRYIDVELAAAEREPALVQGLVDAGAALILSSHDHEGRPPDLLRRLATMAAHPAGTVVKLAWRARSLRDNLEAFDLLTSRPGPAIALCMGTFGLPSRVLARKFGGLLTFAQVDDDDEYQPTAAGQPTIDELRELYRFDSIGAGTSLYGVIGWPVAHSQGPRLHNGWFAEKGLDGVYLPLPVPPEYEHFKATVAALLDHAGVDFRGASVTLPHKTHLVRFVRDWGGDVDDASAFVGAANTLVRRAGGSIEARNTDVSAAVDALCAGMEIERSGLAGRRIAVLGAGGVARAVVGGLVMAGSEVVVFNRSRERAAELAGELDASVGEAGTLDASFDVIVNCTPIGMAGGPAAAESPLAEFAGERDPVGPSVTVFDTVYTPARTPLITEAEARGARVVTGDGMFMRQAAAQFEAWTAAR